MWKFKSLIQAFSKIPPKIVKVEHCMRWGYSNAVHRLEQELEFLRVNAEVIGHQTAVSTSGFIDRDRKVLGDSGRRKRKGDINIQRFERRSSSQIKIAIDRQENI